MRSNSPSPENFARSIPVLAALALAGIFAVAQSQQHQTASVPKACTLSPMEIFKANCARCHYSDGSGDTFFGRKYKIPDLRSADVQKLSDKDLTQIINKGKNRMPTWEKKLAKEDIAKVLSVVRGFGQQSAKPDPQGSRN